ncbi:MAG: hypothetical protein ORN26_01765 [Candidatus Pacebacteria bacterium]|nr:hypothetical protein [Candidatus Paceibacterota bacterium]
MFDRLEELKNPHPSPEQQPQTSISTTLTKEQTPQVLEGEIIQPVNLDVNVYPSNKGYNKEVKPITIEGEYRKIDDGTDDIVKDTRVSYRDQGLIDAGHNNYKLKIKGIEIPQGGPNNIPETNNQRFTVKKPEVLDVEKVYSGGTRGPGSHIPPVGDGQTIDQEGEQSKGSSR